MANKLSTDNAAARAVGLSYGYYMAIYGGTAAEAQKGNLKPCIFCGKLFESAHGRKYCSYDCYEQRNAIAAKERYLAKRGGGRK